MNDEEVAEKAEMPKISLRGMWDILKMDDLDYVSFT